MAAVPLAFRSCSGAERGAFRASGAPRVLCDRSPTVRHMDSITKAVIYVPHADRVAGSAVCLRWCEEQAHQVVSLAHRWRDVVTLLCADLAQVAVVATRADLAPTRTPRVEIVDEEISYRSPQRRPRVYPPRGDR